MEGNCGQIQTYLEKSTNLFIMLRSGIDHLGRINIPLQVKMNIISNYFV